MMTDVDNVMDPKRGKSHAGIVVVIVNEKTWF